MTFEEFAAARLPALLRYAVVLTGDRELAEDLVQDVMIRVHLRWRRVQRVDRPELYVKRAVTNEFLSWRRRWRTRASVSTPGRPVADPAALIVERSDLWGRVLRLPRQQRVVLALRFYEGLSDPEIAEVLGCAPGTVRGYASRAIATLRAEFAAAEREEQT